MAGRRKPTEKKNNQKNNKLSPDCRWWPFETQLWNRPLCSSLVVQLHLRPKAVLKRRGGGGVAGGRVGDLGRGVDSVQESLDALAALHLWFILSRLHLDGHHIVARWHVIVSAVRHLLLGYDSVDFSQDGLKSSLYIGGIQSWGL